MTAFGVRASDAGYTLSIVAAGEETSRHAGDAFEAEIAQILRVARVVLGCESPEVGNPPQDEATLGIQSP